MKELIQYIKERYHPAQYVPVVALVSVTAYHLNPFLFHLNSKLLVVLVITSILFMYRIIDDLGDLKFERTQYPHRTLSRSQNLSKYWLLSSGLFLINSLGLFYLTRGNTNLTLFVAYTLFLKLYYFRLRDFLPSTYLKTLVPITRYPMTVLFLLSEHVRLYTSTEVIFFLLFLFLSLRLYDWSHDKALLEHKKIILWLQALYGILLVWGLFFAVNVYGSEFYLFRIIATVAFCIYIADFYWKRFLPAFGIVHLTLILNLALMLIKERQLPL